MTCKHLLFSFCKLFRRPVTNIVRNQNNLLAFDLNLKFDDFHSGSSTQLLQYGLGKNDSLGIPDGSDLTYESHDTVLLGITLLGAIQPARPDCYNNCYNILLSRNNLFSREFVLKPLQISFHERSPNLLNPSFE